MSAFKKSLLVAGVAMILSNNVFADEGHGIVKFKGEVISAPCSIKPGDEDLTVNLGEVADTVLKSDQKSLAEPFTIHLQDCMLSQGGTTYSKAKVTFTTANTMTGQSDLLKNTKETEIGGATGVGVRILDSQSGEVLMNPLMIFIKIIKLRWIHILSYDQMVSRKINNQTTRCANSIFYTTLFTNSAPNYT